MRSHRHAGDLFCGERILLYVARQRSTNACAHIHARVRWKKCGTSFLFGADNLSLRFSLDTCATHVQRLTYLAFWTRCFHLLDTLCDATCMYRHHRLSRTHDKVCNREGFARGNGFLYKYRMLNIEHYVNVEERETRKTSFIKSQILVYVC